MKLLFLPQDAQEVMALLDAGHRPTVKQVLLRPDYSEFWVYLGPTKEYVAIVSVYLGRHEGVKRQVAELARGPLAELALLVLNAVCNGEMGTANGVTLEDLE